jgi:parallel beta-helix repeat protein
VGVVACGLAAILLLAPAAGAGEGKRKIQVHPGPNAIAKALDRADDGDVLRIHSGRYEETLGIDKRVRLVAAGKRRPVIDGDCVTRSTVQALADGVRLRGLKVVGGLAIEIDFRGVSGGRANQVVVRDTCDARYGINLYDTGPMKIVKSKALGFDDAGFYIGEITSTGGGSIRLTRSDSFSNLRGLILEDSAGGDIRVRNNHFHDNNLPPEPTGIFVNRTDGVLFEGNRVRGNGAFGIHISPDSDRNVFNSNTVLGNPTDIGDEGSGNCGSDNQSQTGDTLPQC